MQLVRFLFRASLILWGVAILTALVGHFTGIDALFGISLGLRRFAPAVTLIWIVVALGRMIWVRYWPFPRRPKNGRPVA